MNRELAALGLGLLLAAPVEAGDTAGHVASTGEPTTLYHVHKGDTLDGLAAHYMTSVQDAAVVQRINGVADPLKIPTSTILRIPTRLLKSIPVTLKVTSIVGSVSRTVGGGRTVALTKGDVIREGDRITTSANAFATLTETDGSRVALPSHTTLRVAILRRVLLEGSSQSQFLIESGRSEMTVTPLHRQSDRFEIRTPAAVAAVRGTEFRVNFDPQTSVSTLEVTHGRVGESAARETAIADILTGQAAQRPLGGERTVLSLPPAPALAPPETFQSRPGAVFKISKPRAGWSYHVLLARDPMFGEVFAETTTNDGVATFDEVPAGNFAAKITAIDEHGIEGFAKVYAVQRLATPTLSPRG